MTTVRIAVGLPTSSGPGTSCGSRLTAFARRVEQLGLDGVSISDVLLGDGTPAIESIVSAAAVGAVTERVRIEFGVLVLPVRQVAWLAAQIAALQHVTHGRIVLGVGAGGFPGSPFWRAVGAPERGRGPVVDAMLRVLPQLIAGTPTTLDLAPSRPTVTLAPPAPVPPILVGGSSEAALRRAVAHADGWFPSLLPPTVLAARVRALRETAAARGRAVPTVHYGTHAMLGRDSTAARDAFVDELVKTFHMSPADAESVVITGRAAEVADRLHALAAAGADSITLSLDGDDPEAQLDTLAEARALLAAP